jgi:hypothetical protein
MTNIARYPIIVWFNNRPKMRNIGK